MPKFKVGDIISRPNPDWAENGIKVRVREVIGLVASWAGSPAYRLKRISPDSESEDFTLRYETCERDYSLHSPLEAFVRSKLESLGYGKV